MSRCIIFTWLPVAFFQRKDAKEWTSGARNITHSALVVSSEGIDSNRDRLAGLDSRVIERDDHEQILARLDTIPKLNCFSADDATDRSVDHCIAEIELSDP